MPECPHCNRQISDSDLSCSFDGVLYHLECLDEITFSCNQCNLRFPREDSFEFESCLYCEDCYHDISFECYSCNGRFYSSERNTSANGDSFCDECWDEDNDNDEESCCHLKTHPMVHPTVAIAWNQGKKIKTFGIEIESNSDFDTPPFFTKVNDGSVAGKEYVSYVLPYNKTGFEIIKEFANTAQSKRAIAGTDCGYHLHLGGYRNSYLNVKKVWLGYLIMENVFFSMMPQSRRNNSFCYRFTNDYTVESILRQNNLPKLLSHFYEKQIRIKSSTPKDSYHSKRYYYVNLHVWLSRQTIEYRLHSGTINANKILMWAEVNKKFTDWLVSKSTSINDVISLTEDKFYKIVGARLKNYILQRINKFGRTKLEVILI